MVAAILIAIAGGAVTFLDLKTGIPFGPFTSDGNTGPKMFPGLPWALPLVWIVAVLNSRGVARLILRPWRKIHGYGFWLIGVTAVLTMLFDCALEPFASQVKHYWYLGDDQISAVVAGRAAGELFRLAGGDAADSGVRHANADQQATAQRRPPDFHPLGDLAGRGFAFWRRRRADGLVAAAALDAVIGIVIAVFAIRGARW